MLFFRQRLCQNNNLFIICSLLLLAGFMVQLKIFYNNHQKQLRLQDYKQRMDDISEMIDSVDKVVNQTSKQLSKLQTMLKPYVAKKKRLKFS